MSLSTKLKTFKPFQLASLAFFAVTGILLLAFLPFTGFPPHLGFLGIVSLIATFSLFTKRAWAPWLVAILFVAITAFCLDTLIEGGFTNLLVALGVLGYAVLTWIFTAGILLKRKD